MSLSTHHGTEMNADWKKTGCLAFWASGNLALLTFFAGALVPAEHHGYVAVAAIVSWWLICGAVAIRRPRILSLVALAAGATWGFLIVISVAISIQDWRVSVNWGPFLLGIIFIPIGLI